MNESQHDDNHNTDHSANLRESLDAIIHDEIARQGPIPFARFMELALYHPTLGYYNGGGADREPIGWEGDFFTSGDLHPLWGWALARQLHQMWELLGKPGRFSVVEPGAGRGLLAPAVWRYALQSAPDWGRALHYYLVDQSPPESPLRAARSQRLAHNLSQLDVPDGRVQWTTLDAFAPDHAGGRGPITGCIVSNELVDALPVHRIEKQGGALREIAVALDAHSGRLIETLGDPSSAAVARYLDEYHIPWRAYPDGWQAEVCLAARNWMRQVARSLARGLILTVDYGDTARRLYTRDRRHGTLMVYAHHQLGERPLAQPGRQDLTAHVNFTALLAAGRAEGLRLAGYTTQRDLLERLGIRAEADALAARLYPYADSERQTSRGQLDYLRRSSLRTAINTLLDPHGLGNFKALALHRSVPGARSALQGFTTTSSA
ncbi:MAG: SAM-dependent methyltransferase [Ktedonobacterales bacterium]